MDQTLTVWETQPTHDAVHLTMGGEPVSCLLCDFCDYLRFYLLDQKNIGVFEYVGDCKGRTWEELSNMLLADHCNGSAHDKLVFKDQILLRKLQWCCGAFNFSTCC